MFVCDVDLSEFETAKRRTHGLMRDVMYRAVGEASRDAVKAARTAGKFKDRTGELRRSIRVISARLNGRGEVAGGYEATAEHASWIEDGTRAHLIRPLDYETMPGGARHTVGVRAGRAVRNPTFGVGRGKFLRFYIRGRVVFAREVRHPGTKPDPFMQPASVVATVTLTRVIEEGVERIQTQVWGK